MTKFTCDICKKNFATKQRLQSHGQRKNPCKPPVVIDSNIAVSLVLKGITYSQLIELIGEDKIVSSNYVNLDETKGELPQVNLFNNVKQNDKIVNPVKIEPSEPVKAEPVKKSVKKVVKKVVKPVKAEPVKKIVKKSSVKNTSNKKVNNVNNCSIREDLEQKINEIDKQIIHTDKLLDLSVRKQVSSVLKKQTKMLLEEKKKLTIERVRTVKALKIAIKNST